MLKSIYIYSLSLCFALRATPIDLKNSLNTLSTKDITLTDNLASTSSKKVQLTYSAYDMQEILTKVFKEDWKKAKFITFICSDGYKSSIPVDKFLANKAYLATSIKGQKDFSLIKAAEKKKVSLSPYYLIWDSAELQQPSFAHFWPYQVVQIELNK
jgi:hypothetical protein